MTPRFSWAVVLLAGCGIDRVYSGNLEKPVAAAVVQPEVGGPFKEPIGYVASGYGGKIWPIALKRGQFLTDDGEASFLRSTPLATGAGRLLTSVATWAPDAETITVFAGDTAFERLLRVPHVIGVEDGEPVEPEPEVVSTTFVDADSSGDEASFRQIVLQSGDATTELWTLTSDGEVWWVEGSRTGRLNDPLRGGHWAPLSDVGMVWIDGAASSGDQLFLEIDNQVDEIDVGGTPVELAMAPDQSLLAMIVEQRDSGSTQLSWFDPLTNALAAAPTLDLAAAPAKLAFSPEGILFVADRELAVVWEIDPQGDAAIAHDLPWPVVDVAPLSTENGRWVYVVPEGTHEVWVYDLDAEALVDVNVSAPGLQGMDVRGPISGIEAIPMKYRWPETDELGAHKWGASVAISLANGRVLFAEEGTGCLVRDGLGPIPRVEKRNTAYDYTTNYDLEEYGPRLLGNGFGDYHVQINPCAGIAQPETWTVRYNRNLSGWEVEGSLSGVQTTLAREDVRYMSDEGAVSFVIASGSAPSEDGSIISFGVSEGVLTADGDNDNDGKPDVNFDTPNDPVFFSYRVGPTDGGWDPVDERPFVLITGQSSDLIGRVEPQTGEIEIALR